MLSYGGEKIPYELRYAKRKSLEIAVHPDRTVTVKAPEGTDLDIIEARVRKRARWPGTAEKRLLLC
ncbi:hypothetical protein NOC27_1840 [Nitrosococcus oceani AFC27]|nr:hypothetical protein NOC27_1840 [Nitrosococcus oceani AFC27]